MPPVAAPILAEACRNPQAAGRRRLVFVRTVGRPVPGCCAPGGAGCKAAADSTATPDAARAYVVGHADTGRVLRLTETASEVVLTQASTDREAISLDCSTDS
ncbi:MAG TPA: hypothetical protein VI365_08335 [Trebonia sp.]